MEDRIIDLPVEPADLVIRVEALPGRGLIARHLLTTEVRTCASPGYLAARGMPSHVADLGRHSLVAGFDRTMTGSYRLADGSVEQIGFRPDNVVSDLVALEPVLVGGAGIGRLPDFMARGTVARGGLMRLFPEAEGDAFGVHALYASNRSLSAKIRVFIDALVESLATGTRTGT